MHSFPNDKDWQVQLQSSQILRWLCWNGVDQESHHRAGTGDINGWGFGFQTKPFVTCLTHPLYTTTYIVGYMFCFQCQGGGGPQLSGDWHIPTATPTEPIDKGNAQSPEDGDLGLCIIINICGINMIRFSLQASKMILTLAPWRIQKDLGAGDWETIHWWNAVEDVQDHWSHFQDGGPIRDFSRRQISGFQVWDSSATHACVFVGLYCVYSCLYSALFHPWTYIRYEIVPTVCTL